MFPRFLFVVLLMKRSLKSEALSSNVLMKTVLQLNNNCIRKYRKTTYETSVYIPLQPFCLRGY